MAVKPMNAQQDLEIRFGPVIESDRRLSHLSCTTVAMSSTAMACRVVEGVHMGKKMESTAGIKKAGSPGKLDRSLHLVDIENLVGAPDLWSPNRIRATFDAYLQAASWQSGDSLVVAANPSFMKMLAFDLVGMAHRPLCARGKDAADELLVGAVPADVGAQFGRLVVGSGDHAFAPLMASLRGRIETLVVTAAGLIAAVLYTATDEVERLSLGPDSKGIYDGSGSAGNGPQDACTRRAVASA